MYAPQTTGNLLMIRPVNFGYNAETAVNNSFQTAQPNQQQVAAEAVLEFDTFVEKLRAEGVHVTVVQDTPDPYTPDSIFPNNWISFHADGTVVLYPMFAENRRKERKAGVLEAVFSAFSHRLTIDFSPREAENSFLEGTGSMVLDRQHNICYACLSARTDGRLVDEWCKIMGYTPVVFDALDGAGQPIYHTNVVMAVADRYVVICMEAVANEAQKQLLTQTIEGCGKTVVAISFEQMNAFAGNMLQVSAAGGQPLLVMSTQAWQSLTEAQQQYLSSMNKVLHSSLYTIEANGGGSARCMMAEVHLPPKA
jgi:hypothetical protein